MKLKMFIAGLVLFVAQSAFAETDYIALELVNKILNGEESFVSLAAADVTTTDDVIVGDDLTVAGDAAVTGTLGVTGVATFTAESVHNLGIDADYITTDAAAGIDTKTAGALLVGAATATSVEIADTTIATDIQGTLSVDEAAVFDTTLGVTGDVTASADVNVTSNLYVSLNLDVTRDAVLRGDLTVSSNVAVLGTVNGADYLFDSTQIGTGLTNDQVLSWNDTVTLIFSGEDGADITNTVAAPGAAHVGSRWTIINTSTNLITIDDGSTIYDTGTISLDDQWDCIELYGYLSGYWIVLNTKLAD